MILTALLFGAAVIAGAGIVAAFWNDLVAFLKKAVEKKTRHEMNQEKLKIYDSLEVHVSVQAIRNFRREAYEAPDIKDVLKKLRRSKTD